MAYHIVTINLTKYSYCLVSTIPVGSVQFLIIVNFNNFAITSIDAVQFII